MTTPRVALIGARGYGEWHLRNLARLAATGRLEPVGVCDTDERAAADVAALLGPAVPVVRDHRELLERLRPEVTVVCTPPHTHLPIAADAVDAGSHVLLEKPPVVSVADHHALVRRAGAAGRVVQVGFQSLGSGAFAALADAIVSGRLGPVTAVTARAHAIRTDSYYARAPWAGRRRLDGVPVLDGVLTNPFAHAVALTLRLAAAAGDGGPPRIEVETYAARPMEADDLACARVRADGQPTVHIAATVCAVATREAVVSVHTPDRNADLFYQAGTLRLPGELVAAERPGGTDLLENLLDHLDAPDGVPLRAELSGLLAFTHVLAAVGETGPAIRIPEPWSRREPGADGDGRWTIDGVDAAVDRASAELALFSELDLPWAPSVARVETSA